MNLSPLILIFRWLIFLVKYAAAAIRRCISIDAILNDFAISSLRIAASGHLCYTFIHRGDACWAAPRRDAARFLSMIAY